MAQKYIESSVFTISSAKLKDTTSVSGAEVSPSANMEDAVLRRSMVSGRTGTSVYSHVTKKSTDFYRTDIGSVEQRAPLGQRVGKFIWNAEDRTFLGRTGLSWARMIIYYILFYGVIGLIWTACYAMFDFAVLSEDRPVLTGDQSVLRLTPSLSYMPQPDYYTSLIRYRNSRYSSARKYIDNLVAFTQWYESYGQQEILSTNENVKDCSADGKNDDPMNSVCRFDLDIGRRCNAYVNFGFVDGDPCFILKLNRVYGWVPDPIDGEENSTDSTLFNGAEQLKQDALPVAPANGVIVRCQGRTESDRHSIKDICYHYTSNGYDGTDTYCKQDFGVFEQYFFPYLKQVRYMSPLVFVEFKGIARHVVVMIECWAEAKNIKIDRTYRIGMVQFEILID